MRIQVKDLVLPLGILFAGLILSVSIYVVRIRHGVEHGMGDVSAIRPVTPADHLIGNPSAPVKIIEYGDIDSAHSKDFQLVMEQLMTEYADGGQVAWVYRHFPLTTEHENAATHALAAECAASLSVPTTFFRFIDAMQAYAPAQNEFNPSNYGLVIAQFGIDETAFKSCIAKGTFTKRVHDDYDNALAAGATGSPFVVLEVAGQKPATINGALPYPTMKKLIERSLAKIGS